MDISEDADNEKYGEKLKYDPSGPFKKSRVRTDVYWLVGFVIFLLVWIIVIIYAFSAGELKRLTKPLDNEGRICGDDPGVKDKPLLVFYDDYNCEAGKCRVCRTECPNERFNFTSKDRNDELLNETLSMMICKPDVKLHLVSTWDQLDYLVVSGKCAQSYDNGTAVGNLCPFEAKKDLYHWKGISQSILIHRDILNAKYSILGFIALSGLVALLSVILMRWYALAFVCGSIFVFCGILFNFIYEICVINAESKTNRMLLSLFICVVLLVVIVLITIYFRRQIYLACQMIRESSKAIMCIISSLLLSLLLIVVQILIAILSIRVFFLLSSLRSPTYAANFAPEESCVCSNTNYYENSICDPASFEADCKIMDTDESCVLSGCYMIGMESRSVGFLQFINIFGLYWSSWFIIGFGDMVLASVFATWYWTFNKRILSYLSLVESFWRVSAYHLGTIALGSLLLAICLIIRCILNDLRRILVKINKPCTALIILNLKCLFDIVDNVLKFIKEQAYIICAIHGTDFFQSAKMMFNLLMRNIGRVIVVFEITTWLSFVITLIISCTITRISISYYDSRHDLYTSSPEIFIFIGSFIVTWRIMKVVEMAVSTIFVCFLEDCERHDGSSDKPYFMSEELTKFLFSNTNFIDNRQ